MTTKVKSKLVKKSKPPDRNEKDIVKFFHGHPISLRLFRRLRKMIEKHSSPIIEVSATQISFGEFYKFLWVWLPQKWIYKRPRNGITLTLLTGNRIKSSRITESVLPKKGFWTHHILIAKEEEIDHEIEQLIECSYDFYLKRMAIKLSR